MGVGMGAAGYPLTNTWGYQTSYPASAYLGYNSAAGAYSSSLAGYGSSVIDPGPLLSAGGVTASTGSSAPLTSDNASPAGKKYFSFLSALKARALCKASFIEFPETDKVDQVFIVSSI